jgi:hypothetical protein
MIRKEKYTSNNPLVPSSDLLFFPTNNAFKIMANARFRIKQKYIDRPDLNYILGSKYPTFFVNYSKGIADILDSDVDYDKLEGGVEDEIRLGMLGSLSYYGVYGKFLNSNRALFYGCCSFQRK